MVAKKLKPYNQQLNSELQSFVSEPALKYKAKKKVAINYTISSLLKQKLILIQLINRGISVNLFTQIVNESQFNLSEWSHVINLPYRTIQRYLKNTKLLKPIHTEKVFEFLQVIEMGNEVFGSDEKFSNWAHNKKHIFGNKRPIDILNTSFGMAIIIKELNRIEHGLFA